VTALLYFTLLQLEAGISPTILHLAHHPAV
jgi:hypothetical protein